MKRSLTPLALMVTLAGSVDAQILRVPRDQGAAPTTWVSAGIGWLLLQNVNDGRTGSTWQFGDAAQYRASIETDVSGGSTLGLVGSWARMPLRYVGPSTGSGCPGATGVCNAHADVRSVHAMFRSAGRQGLHQVFELQAGFTQFSNFEADGSGEPLLPDKDTDFSFAVGYGLGWGFGRSTHLALVQDYSSIFHQRDGLPGGTRSTIQAYMTRLQLRFGF